MHTCRVCTQLNTHHNDSSNSLLRATLGSLTSSSFNLNISQDVDELHQQIVDDGHNATQQQQQKQITHQNPPRNGRRRPCETGHHYEN